MPPKADKEIIIFLADAGKHPRDGDDNYFEKAKEVMTLIIEKKIFLRPMDEIGVVLGARGDDNDGEDEKSSVKFYREIHVPSWETVSDVRKLESSDEVFNNLGEILSDISSCVEKIGDAHRVILLLLLDCHDDCQGIEPEHEQAIVESMTTNDVHLLWIGSKALRDFPENKLNKSEKALMNIVKLANGEYMTIEKTLPSLRIFKHNNTRFTAWTCDLEFGDITIPTSMYVQATRVEKTKKFQTIATEGSDTTPEALAVRSEREYLDRFKKAHSIEDTISGYMFGRQLIPVTDADQSGMNFDGGPKSFVVNGFVPRDAIALEDLAGDSSRFVIPESLETAEPFYCLLRAMMDEDIVAVVRRVYADKNCPKMGILVPHDVPNEAPGLIFIEVLYAEDRRVQKYRSYEAVKKRLTEEKRKAIGNLIDSMMLTGSDDEPEPFYPGTVHSPGLQHMFNCLSQRALNPDEPLPEMDENLKKLLERPESIRISAEPFIKKLKGLFPIPERQVLADLKKESTSTVDQATVPATVPVLSEVKKMENEMAEKIVPCPPPPEDVDLDGLFDEDMSM